MFAFLYSLLYYLCIAALVAAVLWILVWRQAEPLSQTPADFPIEREMPTVATTDYPAKFAVIGAGFCGLGMGASLRRAGIPFDILEETDHVGGNWAHGVYDTAHIISSRNTTEYKDFPMPAHYPDFPSRVEVLTYFQNYAAHMKLYDHINYNSRVEACTPLDGGNQWQVKLVNGETRTYKGVIVCTGHHWSKRFPKYEGNFTGEVMHSKDFKKGDIFVGKRVLTVGGGNSACDVSVEAARFGVESHISVRRGYWFLPRSLFGVPSVDIIKPYIPLWLQRVLIGLALRITVGKYSNYGLPEPDHRIFDHHPTINSDLLHTIKLGMIKPHGDIRRFEGKTVHFVDGTSIEVDTIVYATGYNMALPMISTDVVSYYEGVPNLVGGTFHPTLRNLYCIGIVGQPRYGAGPLISNGTKMLCKVIRAQETIQSPIGALMKRLGGKAEKKSIYSADVIHDPHTMYLRSRVISLFIPLLPYIEKLVGMNKRKTD